MRLPWPAVLGGVAVAALGAAGLIRGAMPQSVASIGPSAAGPIVVTGAYVRAPVPPTQIAAAYFTVYNTTGTADRLTGVQTGAGATAELHRVNADGSMSASPRGAVIPAHGSLVLSTGKAHVMIEQLFGKVVAGQTVNIELDFQNAGSIDLVAPVIGIGQQPPTAGTAAPSGAPS
jgi:copper(I)-binding protein